MKKTEIDPKTGIDIAQVNVEILDGYLTKLGLSTKGIVPLRLLRLHEAMQLFPDKSKLANCSPSEGKPGGCRGSSHVDLKCCPFCGDGDSDQTVASQRSNVADPEQLVINELKQLIAKKMVADEQAEKAAKDKPATVPSPVAGQSLVPVARNKRAAKKPAQSALALDTPAAPAVDTPVTEADLDKSNEIIRDGFKRAASGIYDAAVELFNVFERKLWMQRRNEDGTSKYSSFADYARLEMEINNAYAYTLLDLPKFFTREQVQTIGASKLTLALRIEESERRNLLESGKLEQMTVREVKAEITQHPSTQARNPERGDKGSKASHTRLPGGTKSSSKSSSKAASKLGSVGTSAPSNDTPVPPPPREPERVLLTTCVLPTAIDFDLFARNKKSNQPDVPATDLKDDPFATITCANGVKMRLIVFKSQDGTLKGSLTIESDATHEHAEHDPEE